uniref:C2 domain-containing protein n=1 Tax=Callorhinchus milii TaxID=7868 RepID=A0A4W3IS64_CALMI
MFFLFHSLVRSLILSLCYSLLLSCFSLALPVSLPSPSLSLFPPLPLFPSPPPPLSFSLSSKTDTMLMDTIASFLVLPNRITCPLMSDLRAAELRSPLPRGIVRIFLVEAVSLESKDTYVKGIIKGRSDPYAIVRVGTQTFMSKTISESINPKWNEMYEVCLCPAHVCQCQCALEHASAPHTHISPHVRGRHPTLLFTSLCDPQSPDVLLSDLRGWMSANFLQQISLRLPTRWKPYSLALINV